MKKNNYKIFSEDELWERKWKLVAVFFLIFFLTLSFLAIVGAVPGGLISISAKDSQESQHITGAEQESLLAERIAPERVVIEKVGIDAHIINPQSRDIKVLDNALADGVVHFPGSGALNEDTNLFLFGHSSYLPVVYNKNFKVFNKLNKLEIGDQIRVQGGGHEYLYRVSTVRLDEAAAIRVELNSDRKMLTLSTCNSFGSEGERFVIEADFVGSYPIST